MADALRGAGENLESIVNPGRSMDRCESQRLFLVSGVALSLAAAVAIGMNGYNLSQPDETPGSKRTSIAGTVIGVLVLVGGAALIRNGVCIKAMK